MCLADSATTHIIFKDKKYFFYLLKGESNVNLISGITKIIEVSGRTNKSLG